MSLTTLNLNLNLYSNDLCTGLILEDDANLYSLDNLNGYNAPNGININDVTALLITLNYTMLGVSAIYTFNVSSGVIGATTLTFAGGTPVNITSQLTNLVFPFSYSNPFNFFTTYIDGSSVVQQLPVIQDGAYSVSYEIRGSSLDITTPTAFDLTATDMELVDCQTCCCVGEMFDSIPVDCGCDNTATSNAILAKSYLETASYAVQNQDATRANIFINKAQSLCDCDCGC